MHNVLSILQFCLMIGFAAILILAMVSVSYYVGQAAEREAEALETRRNDIRRAPSKEWFHEITPRKPNGERFNRL